jgi:membrane-bound metal-dependent hydrolase YbcI (DUF457 family)
MEEKPNPTFHFGLLSVFALTTLVALCLWYGSLIPRNYIPISVVMFISIALGVLLGIRFPRT